MKKVIAIYFSQSGQQLRILQSLVKPLQQQGFEIHFEELKPVNPFPFPWKSFDFFNIFPETFAEQPIDLLPLSEKAKLEYDLVILGYQPWFLSPSRPMNSFLQSEEGKRIISDKPVITILGCRNMWLGAQEKVKRRLISAKGKLVGHISLADRYGNLTSLITILRWMFTGKKNSFLCFPAAGVSDIDIEHASAFGKIIGKAVGANNFINLQDELNSEGAIDIKPNLILLEKRGQKAFSVWSKFVAAGGSMNSTGRKLRVYTFMYILPPAIFVLSPLLWLLSIILLIVKRKKLKTEVAYFRQNSLR